MEMPGESCLAGINFIPCATDRFRAGGKPKMLHRRAKLGSGTYLTRFDLINVNDFWISTFLSHRSSVDFILARLRPRSTGFTTCPQSSQFVSLPYLWVPLSALGSI